LGTLLTEFGFAPMSDRAKMVRPVMQWVREPALEPAMILKPTAPVIGAPFILPTPSGTALPRSRVLVAGDAQGFAAGVPVQRVGVHSAA
jgi:hypothetical protein